MLLATYNSTMLHASSGNLPALSQTDNPTLGASACSIPLTPHTLL